MHVACALKESELTNFVVKPSSGFINFKLTRNLDLSQKLPFYLCTQKIQQIFAS